MDYPFMETSLKVTLAQIAPGGFALSDFWSLVQQAGPLRWPIFLVLATGLVQVFLKLYELMRDRSVSKALSQADFRNSTLAQITRRVGEQEESMLASLQASMLNVFQTRSSEGMLHDEISNFVSFQKDQFSVFRRRMEFLSDTAGALGLMGTVWGMFTVFFQGTAEQEVILRGMGIALITTLLGLVVSIILNFSATELSTFFGKRMEQVSRRSDDLRFRLLELGSERTPRASPEAGHTVMEARLVPAPQAPTPSRPPPEPVVPEPSWLYIDTNGVRRSVQAGEAVNDLRLFVKNDKGEPAPGVRVVVVIPGPTGTLAGGERSGRLESNAKGIVSFGYTAPDTVGPFELDVSLPQQPGPPARLELMVHAGPPHRVDQEGNNQAAVVGMRLSSPLSVLVRDRFGNPVSGLPVEFEVAKGSGKLASGQVKHKAATDALGVARTPFVVSSDAGPNVVVARVDQMKESVDFVAFGTEV